MTVATNTMNDAVRSLRPWAEKAARRSSRRLPPAVTPDDVLAACLAGVWRALRRSGLGARLTGEVARYCYRAALYEARRLLRKESRRGLRGAPRAVRPVVASEAAEGDGPALADLVAAREPGGAGGPGGFVQPFGWWQELLRPLTPEQRRAVLGRVVSGLSWAAIGAAEGVGETTARETFLAAVNVLKVTRPGLEEELRAAVAG